MAVAKKTKTARGRKQDRARVADGQKYEVGGTSPKRQDGRRQRSRKLSKRSATAGSASRTVSGARSLHSPDAQRVA